MVNYRQHHFAGYAIPVYPKQDNYSHYSLLAIIIKPINQQKLNACCNLGKDHHTS